MFPTDFSITPVDIASAAEDRGFESLFFPEHSHIPASGKSRPPSGRELPREYAHSLDPFVALATAATVTTTLKLGTGICLVAQRDPIILAKEIASLDHLSRGRCLFGIGAGWNAEELANHGTEFGDRWGVLEDRVEAMRTIWTQKEASYEGEHVRFERIYSWPKPVQDPHPPVILGGHGRKALERVVRYCNGWMPSREVDIEKRARELREMAEDAGRDPASISISIFGGGLDPESTEAYRAAGVERVILLLKSHPVDKALKQLDDYVEAIERTR